MNRYLIAALYVMAGCAVTVPLKVQASPEPLNGERCRLIITSTVKVVTIYLEEDRYSQTSCVLSSDYFHFSNLAPVVADFSFSRPECPVPGSLCLTSHRIRAPELF